MPAVATHSPALAEDRREEGRLFEPGGVTLEDAVIAAWDELIATGHAACPVCGGSMTPAGGCSSCGSELS